jgi:hypothetical protein
MLDCSEYSHAWSIDERHARILHQIVRACPFRRVLECGCFQGGSAIAFVAALEQGCEFDLTLCDVSITPGLRQLVAACSRADRITLTERPSWEVIDASYDFVFIDADHAFPGAGRDLAAVLKADVATVALHDTQASAAGYPGCEGAELLGTVYRRLAGWRHVEDALVRAGERTNRGLLVATRDRAAWPAIVAAYAEST